MLKEKKIKANNSLFKKGVEEILDNDSSTEKSLSRLKIQNDVFDTSDSIADCAKWLSLMTTMMSRLYEQTPEVQKAALSVEDRAFIEYAFSKFATTTTRADNQFAFEGNILIDRIMDRQSKIGSILGNN